MQLIGAAGSAETVRLDRFSYCVELNADVASFMQRTKVRTLLALVVGFILLGLGGAIVTIFPDRVDDGPGHAPDWRLLLTAASCTLCGIGLFYFGATDARRRAWNEARDRVHAITNEKAIPVSIEDAATCGQLKLAPDDVAFLAADPTSGIVQIEGVGFRYGIRAADVLTVEGQRTNADFAIVVTYAIDNVVLSIAIFDSRLAAAFRRQLKIPGSALLNQLKSALRPPTAA